MSKQSPTVLDPTTIKERIGSGYPDPFHKPCATRSKRALGDAFGLKNFGVNLVRLPPGAWSSQRHWHTRQDELVYIVEGEITLVTDSGEQTMKPGMIAGFPAGKADGHHLINKTGRDAVYLEIGDRSSGDEAAYPDVDLHAVPGPSIAMHKDGTKY
ncbi:MAG: cupin domain-containing protein [Proteobacteria bacterium]|nr:cupin domain-containing protein [Pseudomonadota bacterium]